MPVTVFALDEFLLWRRAVKTAGVSGLKIKRVQDHRTRRAERSRNVGDSPTQPLATTRWPSKFNQRCSAS